MIVLFSDFGSQDLYAGQVKAVLAELAPNVPVIDLLHDVPAFGITPGAHLLSALTRQFSPGTMFFCVVDPGVGGVRQGVVLLADGCWYVGPDNGLLAVVAARARDVRVWRIDWRPEGLSSSFHGRDLFAPMAAWIAKGEFPHDALAAIDGLQVKACASDAFEIIFIDHYGNAMTGVRGGNVGKREQIRLGENILNHARTFSSVPLGQVFWYENSIGLVEVAANCGNAAAMLGLRVGDMVRVLGPAASSAM